MWKSRKAARKAYWRPRADDSAAGVCLCSTANRCSPTPTRIRMARSTRTRARTRRASPELSKLTPGKHTIAFDFAYDGGGIGKGGQGNPHGRWQEGGGGTHREDQSVPFSLDESFDVGQDTGTPVIDEYDAKMPFQFTGTLARIQIHLSPSKLIPAQTSEINRQSKDFGLAVQ